jgi:transposase
VLLSCFGNVPAERSARLIGMLTGQDVSAGWVDKAVARVNDGLVRAGFDEAMLAALAAEDVLAADETPVNVVDKTPLPDPEPGDPGEADPEEKAGKQDKAAAGAPHVLVVTTPDGRLTFLQALASRRKGSVGGGIPAAFTGFLMTDGYTGYQHLIGPRIKNIQQCCQHVIRRARHVQGLGPGHVQDWAADIIAILRDAHAAVEDARARGDTALDRQVLDDLRERYDTAAEFGRVHNRLRDWDKGNHPGYALACWLRDYKEQVFLFTRDFAVDWTNNVSERGAKKAKRHQAVSGCWQSLATLGRWCRLASYLDSAAAHGTAALDAVRAVIEGNPWLPPLPAVS